MMHFSDGVAGVETTIQIRVSAECYNILNLSQMIQTEMYIQMRKLRLERVWIIQINTKLPRI